jgi:DNA-binding GntR family transcriptional regulator
MKAVDKAYGAVRAAIFAGEYPPGSRITEQEIVERVGVSRTPVREALRRLQSEGVVTAEPNHGVVVTAFSKEEADQIFELRALLESYCARLAADRIGRDDLKHIRKLADQQLAEASKRRRNLDRISALNTRALRANILLESDARADSTDSRQSATCQCGRRYHCSRKRLLARRQHLAMRRVAAVLACPPFGVFDQCELDTDAAPATVGDEHAELSDTVGPQNRDNAAASLREDATVSGCE